MSYSLHDILQNMSKDLSLEEAVEICNRAGEKLGVKSEVVPDDIYPDTVMLRTTLNKPSGKISFITYSPEHPKSLIYYAVREVWLNTNSDETESLYYALSLTPSGNILRQL